MEAFATVALVGLELNPELARARGEGDWPLIGLTCLIGGDGGGKGWRKSTNIHRFSKTIRAISNVYHSSLSVDDLVTLVLSAMPSFHTEKKRRENVPLIG